MSWGRRIAISLAALAPLPGCGGTGDDGAGGVGSEVAVGRHNAAIVHGDPSPSEHDAVVFLRYKYEEGGEIHCSGTLLAPNLVATARHCIVDTPDVPYLCSANGEPVETGTGGGVITKDTVPESLDVYVGNFAHNVNEAPPHARGVKVFHDGAQTLCSHDLALVLLDREVDEAPRAPLRLHAQVAQGETISVVGWGDDDATTVESTRVRRFSSGVPIIKVGPLIADPGAEGFEVVPRTFATGPALCNGDSGGAAFSEQGAVVGIAIRVTGPPDLPDPCGSPSVESVFMQLPSYEGMIVEALTEAGQAIWLEGEPPLGSVELGGACGADRLCQSGRCFVAEGAESGVCTTSCNLDADCGAELGCVDSAEGPLCLPPSFEPPRSDASGCTVASGPASRRGIACWLLPALGALAWRRRRSE